jgi:hypothetical protein
MEHQHLMMAELERAAATLMSPHLADAAALKAAEEVLLQFKNTPQPFALCQAILQQSQTELVIFEAIGVLRDALLREWPQLPPELREQFKLLLLTFAIHNQSVPIWLLLSLLL